MALVVAPCQVQKTYTYDTMKIGQNTIAYIDLRGLQEFIYYMDGPDPLGLGDTSQTYL
jgi:hypothetical protein